MGDKKTVLEVLGEPAWTRERMFSDVLKRWKNQGDLDRLIEGWTRNLEKRQFTPKAAPILGQDNEYILTNLLGLSQEDVSALEKESIIYATSCRK